MAITPYIQSKTQLVEYIKQRLGYPVINIEVTDVQIDHCINLTMDKFVEFAEGGTQLRFMNLQILGNTQRYTLSRDVYAIYNIYNISPNEIDGVFPDKVIADTFGSKLVTATKGDLLTIDLTREYLAQVDYLLKVQMNYEFNTVTKELYLMENPRSNVKIGLAFYQMIDYSDEDSPVYDHLWVKNYTTALTKKQWADNLLKYGGSMLAGGIQLNPESILTEANTEIEKLELELEEVWRLPADFFTG
jgi:hypothetical protein